MIIKFWKTWWIPIGCMALLILLGVCVAMSIPPSYNKVEIDHMSIII